MNKLQYLYNTLKINKSIKLLHGNYYNYETNTDKHKRNYVLKYITPFLYKQVMKQGHIFYGTIKLIDFKVLNFDPNDPTFICVRYRKDNKVLKTFVRVPSFKDTINELKMINYKQQLMKRGNKYGY